MKKEFYDLKDLFGIRSRKKGFNSIKLNEKKDEQTDSTATPTQEQKP